MSDDENLSLVRQNSAISTGSLESFASDDDAQIEETIYPEAPWDIYSESEFVGKVKVAQTGDKLPWKPNTLRRKEGLLESSSGKKQKGIYCQFRICLQCV